MIRRPPRSTLSSSSAASDVYKRQIEDTIVIDSVEYRFIDTAGLRETSDIVEVIGIKKTHEKIDQAAVILLIDEITDSAESINKRTQLIREMIKGSEKCLIILINKTDAAPDNLSL